MLPARYEASTEKRWQRRLQLAYDAALSSSDPSTQNGALLYSRCDEAWIGHRGFNRVPSIASASDEPERLLADRERRYKHTIHAEVDAVALAARDGWTVQGSTLVCPWASCLPCAAVLIAAGLSRLVVHFERLQLTHEPWREDVRVALAWLVNSGVLLTVYTGTIPKAEPIRVNGALWQP